MTIALVQSTALGVTGTAPITLTLNGVTPLNNLILFTATQSTATTASTVADSAGTFTLAVDSNFAGSNPYCHAMIWYQESAAGGTHTVTVTQAATARSSYAILMEWNGLVGSSSLDKTASTKEPIGGGGVTQNTVSGTTAIGSSKNELAIAGVAVISSLGAANISLTDPPPGYISLGASQSDVATTSIGAEVCYFIAGFPAALSTAWAWVDANTTGAGAVIATFKGVLPLDPLNAQVCL